jgi:hypothetical protein
MFAPGRRFSRGFAGCAEDHGRRRGRWHAKPPDVARHGFVVLQESIAYWNCFGAPSATAWCDRLLPYRTALKAPVLKYARACCRPCVSVSSCLSFSHLGGWHRLRHPGLLATVRFRLAPNLAPDFTALIAALVLPETETACSIQQGIAFIDTRERRWSCRAPNPTCGLICQPIRPAFL